MKVLLSTIGSRGEVQPMLGLAVELRALGQDVLLCVPPTFKTWVESFGFACAPLGIDVRTIGRTRPTPAQLAKLVPEMVREQFRVCAVAAQGCDLIVVGGNLQTAARSIAEHLDVPYVYATFCPGTLRSPRHPPPRIRQQRLPSPINRLLWTLSERSWDRLFGGALDEQRRALGLPSVASVPRYIVTERPWIAADRALTDGPDGANDSAQTGAWLLEDPTPLPDELEQFLAAGAPPIYFGFGSMRAAPGTSRILVDVARALGRRALIAKGWAGLEPIASAGDCSWIGDVDHRRLFPRVAAVVHHGGAGTTTTAALAGRPQVIVPHMYDQFYWAERVRRLGIGVLGPRPARLDADGLVRAVRACLRPAVADAAAAFAPRVERHGARLAAERLVAIARDGGAAISA